MTPDETLAAMFAAWRADIESVPFPAFAPDQPITHCPLCKQKWANCKCR